MCHLFDHNADDDAVLAGDPVRFEAAYPDLVGHARQEPWFGMIEAADPDDFFHSAERCANSAATVHMLASDPQARALFLAWRFPRPAGMRLPLKNVSLAEGSNLSKEVQKWVIGVGRFFYTITSHVVALLVLLPNGMFINRLCSLQAGWITARSAL
ncbi:hypothetical protein [Ralstonia solanacearum]|uniref:hypothetical protein n=1 Tax=Ralstonia solanacearum TaxID=305 RepID=UPI001F155E37|nr:hypothetical protein [Ralstonia solanacearum]